MSLSEESAQAEDVECFCGATIRLVEFKGLKRWVGRTVNPPHELSSFCYPEANGADADALHEPYSL